MDVGAHRSKIAAFALLSLGVAVYLSFAVGEIAGGDVSGLQHLVPAAVLALLLWVDGATPAERASS